ncbi:MAG: hypothetical protein KDA42_07805, partial [Planctomycetales bacterium]|nr:hypothetical protein [Planctomycetales bacterium]
IVTPSTTTAAADNAPPAERLPQPAVEGPLSVTVPLRADVVAEDITIHDDAGLISLAARDASMKDVLALIARTKGLNLVYATNVDDRLTLTLDRVTMEDALDSILSVSGYTWNWNKNIIHVSKVDAGTPLPPEIQGRQVRVFELDYASAIDVDQVIKGMLSPIGKSFVSQSSPTDNRRTKEIVVVEDLPAYLVRIEQYIVQVDQPPRQVLIQVHILEVDLEDECRHGVNFEQLAQIANTDLSIRTRGLANPIAPQAFFLQLSGGDLSGIVEALKSTTDAKTLASPRITAVNGQESRIQIGQQLGFRVTTATETTSLESVEFIDVGVVVRVTPHITRDGNVLMRIKPEVSTGQVNPDTGLPEEETTEVETDVFLADGQGVIIGGLIQEKDTNVQSKVPFLGDIKYAGALFQRRTVAKERSEVVVALIPHVFPLTPCEQQRMEFDGMRASQPLLHGALCRHPRPYEPQLADTFRNPVPVMPARRAAFRAAQCGDCQTAPCPPGSNSQSSCWPRIEHPNLALPPEAVLLPPTE